MPIQDSVNEKVKVFYAHYVGVAGPTVGPTFDTISFTPILSISASVLTYSYANDMEIVFEQSDDSGFASPEVIQSNQIINPFNTQMITEAVTPLTSEVPLWGFNGIKRYFRINTVAGLVNSLIIEIEVRLVQKPAIEN